MGKQARERRREAQQARRVAGPGAEVADRADRALAALMRGITEFAAFKGHPLHSLDLGRFSQMREHFVGLGYRWPRWCYMPAAVVGTGLGKEIALDVTGNVLSSATVMATLAAAWVPGRIAVRFDDDVATALMDTPLESKIPTEVLQRLPAWGLYIDCPSLGPGTGFFVALDAGTTRGPDGFSQDEVDELFVAVVPGAADGPSVMVSSLWLKPGLSIAESIALQLEESRRLNSISLQSPDEVWRASLGMGRAEVTARLLNLLLYLCADATDVTRRGVPPANPSSRTPHRADTVVLSAGFRLGAALRAAAAQYSHSRGEGTGNRVAPHLRRAHWHHYWTGSEVRQTRRLMLHWIAPFLVNRDLADDLVTVVRPAGKP